MKMYTLEYDCNLPTTQQVNVPTNSDFKIGFGVTRNGKKSILSPAEITLTDGSQTLSCDAAKTKGYPTVSMQTGGEAQMKQYTVSVSKGYDFNDVIYCHGFATAATAVTDMSTSPDYNTDALSIAGMEVFAKDIYRGGNNNLDADTTDVSQISNWTQNAKPGVAGKVFMYKLSGDAVDTTTYMQPVWTFPEQWEAYGHPGHEAGPGWQIIENNVGKAVEESIVIPSGYRLADPGLKGKANKYYIIGWKFTAGVPYSANFKMNVNTYKSQAADIAAATDGARTFNFSGEFADGTDFDYDVVVK